MLQGRAYYRASGIADTQSMLTTHTKVNTADFSRKVILQDRCFGKKAGH